MRIYNMKWMVAIYLVALLGATGAVNAAQATYHKSATQAEVALHDALQAIVEDGGLVADLAAGAASQAKAKRAAALFTPRLIKDLQKEYKRDVAQQCGGQDGPGAQCALAVDPLLCAQEDNDGHYEYQTISQAARRAEIAMRWAGSEREARPRAVYRLIKTEGVWKIDAVACGGGDKKIRKGGERGFGENGNRRE